MLKLVALIFAISALVSCSGASQTVSEASEHVGKVSIVDADTIDIRENRYRFDGIDSPEEGSRCGKTNVYQKAAFVLDDIIDGRNVECEPNGKKDGKRIIATCFVLNPGESRTNISEALVSSGWARDWPKFSKGRFAELEAQARASKAGIWGLDCPDDLWGSRNYD